MRRVLATCVCVLVAGWPGSAAAGWLQTWGTIPAPPGSPHNNGWNGLVFADVTSRFYLYANDSGGIVTFQNALVSYGLQGQAATLDPWQLESTCGTSTTQPLPNQYITLGAPIGAADNVLTLTVASGFPSSIPAHGTLVCDNEAMDYTATDAKTGATSATFTGLTRGVRTAAGNGPPSPHAAGALVHFACPAPNAHGVPIADHPADRHPVREVAYDSKHGRLWQVGGYYENYTYKDTWYWCLAPSGECAANQVDHWVRLVTPTNVPGRQEGAITYDSDDDMLVLYGGLATGTPQRDTWVLCFEPNASVGCAEAGTWTRIDTIGDAGPRNALTMAYDSVSHQVLLYGGGGNGTGAYDTVGIYDPHTKTWRTSANATGPTPPATKFPPFVFDPNRALAVLYTGPGGLYTYDVATDAWKLTDVVGGPTPHPPGSQNSNNLSFDPVDDVYVYEQSGVGAFETWELRGDAISTPPVGNDDAGATMDAGSDAAPDAGAPPAETAEGCACRTSNRSSNGDTWLAIVAFFGIVRRRARRQT